VVATLGTPAKTIYKQVILEITTSWIKMIRSVPIARSVAICSKVRHPLTTISVRTPPPLKAVYYMQCEFPMAHSSRPEVQDRMLALAYYFAGSDDAGTVLY
jgi:hypothetical protein